jgi:PAS domain S-box-containing protein
VARYALALAVTALTFALRWLAPASYGPMLVLFCIALLLAALAGTGPGLVATAITAVGVAGLLLPAGAGLALSRPEDLLRWSLVVLFGLLASVLAGRAAAGIRRGTQRLLLQAQVLEHVSEAVVAIDGQQRVIFWSRGAEQLYGVTEKEAVGRVVHDLFTWVWRAPGARAAAYAELARTRIWRGENGLRLRDGRELDAESTVTVLRSEGATPWLLSVVRDVTGARRLEREQAAGQARLEAALGVVDVGVFNQDVGLRYTWAQPARFLTEPLLGRTDHELRDRPGLAGLEELIAVKQLVLATGAGARRELQLGQGPARRWFDVAVEPVRDGAGQVIGLSTATLDVSSRKRDEGRLRESREQLRALAGQLRSSREAEQIRIARDLHDDLGQGLTALKMQLRRLERAVEERPASDGLNGLLDGLVAASALADEIMAAVKRIALDLRSDTLDLLGIAAALREEARRFEWRTGLACRAEVTDEVPPLGPDLPTALYRICQEALTNVSRHAQATGVVVRLGVAEGQVVLSIEDDGRGFDAAAVASPRALGLLGMKERARALDGAVAISRGPGGGTVVTARFPLPTAPPALTPEPQAPPARPPDDA